MSERTSWYTCHHCKQPSVEGDRLVRCRIAGTRLWLELHRGCIESAQAELIDGSTLEVPAHA